MKTISKYAPYLLCLGLGAGQLAVAEEAIQAAQANNPAEAAQEEQAKPEVVTVPDLLNFMVREGIVTKEKAEELIQDAGIKSRGRVGGAVDVTKELDKEHKKVMDPSVVRVPYIPQYLKDEIRDQVQIGLKEDVTRDIMSQAKREAWGVPGTLPTWTKRIKLSGDFRVRYQGDLFSDSNFPRYADYNKVNASGEPAGGDNPFFINTIEDRQRMRARFRLGLKAKITEGITLKTRLASGDRSDPVSTNETFESYDGSYEVAIDRAYLKFENLSQSDQFYAGKMPSPFVSTDLMWDGDFTLDGIANRWWILRDEDNDEEILFDPFVTVGAYSLDEVKLSSDDKRLFALQTGFNWQTYSQNVFTFALSYYHYENVTGKRNSLGSIEYDHTAPDFFQKGNSVFDIRNDTEQGTALVALASEFKNVGLNFKADFTFFAPIHVYVNADYFVNIGYDREEIDERVIVDDVDSDEDTAYQVKFKVGWPNLAKRRDWQAGLTYRYVEKDAFIDAFTDSDFHLGGTDAKGTILEGSYAFRENTWMTLRWISTNEIKLQTLAVDTIQLDLNTRF